MLKSLQLGLKRHPLRFISSTFLAYSALWTIISSFYFFNPDIKFVGPGYHLAFIAVSLLIGMFIVYQPRKISIKINTSDTVLNVYYGDLFEQNGYMAISVNEFFDSEIGLPVSPDSLHGIVINKYFGGHPEAFDRVVSEQLVNDSPIHIDRDLGKTDKYSIGTTASIRANNHKFLLFALSHTDIQTHKASSDLSIMLDALGGLFDKARTVSGGEPLVLPLIGSGISGVGLPATQLLQLIILAIIDATKKCQICKQIDLVLHEDRFSEVDLELIKKQWS